MLVVCSFIFRLQKQEPMQGHEMPCPVAEVGGTCAAHRRR